MCVCRVLDIIIVITVISSHNILFGLRRKTYKLQVPADDRSWSSNGEIRRKLSSNLARDKPQNIFLRYKPYYTWLMVRDYCVHCRNNTYEPYMFGHPSRSSPSDAPARAHCSSIVMPSYLYRRALLTLFRLIHHWMPPNKDYTRRTIAEYHTALLN